MQVYACRGADHESKREPCLPLVANNNRPFTCGIRSSTKAVHLFFSSFLSFLSRKLLAYGKIDNYKFLLDREDVCMHLLIKLDFIDNFLFFSLTLYSVNAYARKKEKEKKMLTCYVTAVQYEWMNNRERHGSNFDSRYKTISDRYKNIHIHIYIYL